MADQLDGKQIKDSSIGDGKLVVLYIKADGTRAFSGPVAGIDPTLSAHLATKNYVDALFQGRDTYRVRLATTGNITLSGNQTIDGVLTTTNDKILVKDAASGATKGLYLANSGAWTRVTDVTLSAGLIVTVSEGSTNAETSWELATDNPIVVGTTALSFVYYAGLKITTITASNKKMTASVTVNDFDQACATTLTAAPSRSGYCAVFVNGVMVTVGSAIKTETCYFSSDGGTTAKAISALAAGDILYWVGSVAGYQLAASDKIDFIYDVQQ